MYMGLTMLGRQLSLSYLNPVLFEVEIAIKKLKILKSPGTD
jgi:hypothetical protein